MATKEDLALERPQQDPFLALIEKVIENPNVDADKLRVLVDLQIQLEERQAAKDFDEAMIAAQKEVLALRWDKVNLESNKSRWVSYPTIDAMLKPIRERHGFTETFGVEPELPAPNMMMMYSDVIHKGPHGSHRRRFHLPMPIDGQGPKGGGVMTGPQAVGNGSSYGMRYLEKLIWKIPMLVDKDDNDGNAIHTAITEAQVNELRKLYDQLGEFRQKKALEKWGIEKLEDLSARKYQQALNDCIRAVRNIGENTTIDQSQEATLTAKIEEIGGDCKEEFLKTNRIKKLSELPASQYSGALEALERQRRK